MERSHFLSLISRAFKICPVVGVLGPRQCGKTTLAQMFASSQGDVTFFDLEDPNHLARLENPKLALSELSGLVIIDEIQRKPELFPLLRVLADRKPLRARFLILGSASRDLIKQSSETLAGRIHYIELTPFNFHETNDLRKQWLRGGFPRSYLARTNAVSFEWRKSYVMTFLERDIPNLGIKIAPSALRRFWLMLAHYHGNIFNASEIGRSLGQADTTVRRYLDILSGTFMIRQLAPWFENIKKRQVRAPKVYFRDTGIFHFLLGISGIKELTLHYRLGASWEGLALEEVIRFTGASEEECYFWATHAGAELDLLILKGEKRIGFEFKYTDTPVITKSMRFAMADLKLDSLTVIYPGEAPIPLDQGIRAVSLEKFLSGN